MLRDRCFLLQSIRAFGLFALVRNRVCTVRDLDGHAIRNANWGDSRESIRSKKKPIPKHQDHLFWKLSLF